MFVVCVLALKKCICLSIPLTCVCAEISRLLYIHKQILPSPLCASHATHITSPTMFKLAIIAFVTAICSLQAGLERVGQIVKRIVTWNHFPFLCDVAYLMSSAIAIPSIEKAHKIWWDGEAGDCEISIKALRAHIRAIYSSLLYFIVTAAAIVLHRKLFIRINRDRKLRVIAAMIMVCRYTVLIRRIDFAVRILLLVCMGMGRDHTLWHSGVYIH